MSIVADMATLRARFKSAFTTLDPLQVVFANGVPKQTDTSKPWVRFTIVPYGNQIATSGDSGINQRNGAVVLQVFIPLSGGTKAAYQIAEEFALVFRRWRSPDIDLWCSTEGLSVVSNDQYFQVNVTVPYTAS